MYRVVLVESSNVPDWECCEFFLDGPFDEVWKQAGEMLEDSRYREVFVYDPDTDAIVYHATDWFGPVIGQFFNSARVG